MHPLMNLALYWAAVFVAVVADAVWNDLSISLMCALAMTATAVPITIRWWRPYYMAAEAG